MESHIYVKNTGEGTLLRKTMKRLVEDESRLYGMRKVGVVGVSLVISLKEYFYCH